VEGRSIPEKIGRYTILCELGTGGMATVYLGRSRGYGNFERLFAIKMIHPNLCEIPEFVSLFLNEARIAARIHHPFVVPVYDIEIEDDRYYLSMDYVSGETLQVALQSTWNRGVPFPTEIGIHAIASVCEGLHAAHELLDDEGDPLGVVHRDVAPQNIILGYDGIVRIMDFGIAKAMDQVSLTQPGQLRGSIPYMAPEQIQRGTIDRRADVFSLGVILWESTVGRRLFEHSSEIGTIARIMSMEVPKPSSIRPEYPPRLEQIVMKCLERDRERRFATAQLLGDELRRFLVFSGICTTSTNIQRFARETFGDRFQHRQAMERSASSVEAPKRVARLPPLASSAARMTPVTPAEEPVELPDVGRLVTEIAVARVAPDEFEVAPPTEVTDAPKVRRPSSKSERPRSVVSPKPKPLSRWPVVAGAGTLALLVAVAVAWPDPEEEEDLGGVPAIGVDPDPAGSGSVSISDMAGDGGKPGTVAFYFRVIPPSAQIDVNGQRTESDLVVPRSKIRYTIRFSHAGHAPQVVSLTAEASRLVEANLEPLPTPEQPKQRKRRRRASR
jgi:serine/threonine-protein kinase